MTMVDSNLSNSQPEDIFMQAVARLEDGEALERVLADFPAAEREEMRELLTVVAATHHLQESAIPQPTQERRATNRRAFLQAAAERKSEAVQQPETEDAALAAITTSAGTAAANTTDSVAKSNVIQRDPTTRTVHPRATATKPTLLQRIGWAWEGFLDSFTPLSTRLAPLALMLLVIWLASFRVVAVAQGAVPGDMAYAAKKWMLYQELVLAPAADRVDVYARIEDTLVQDAKIAAERGVIVNQSVELIYHGTAGGFLLIGDFAVTSQSLTSEIALDQLQEGDRVRLTYQLLPGDEARTINDRLVVQGIALSIIPDPVVIPATATPVATATATATATPRPTDTPVCSRWRPTGWVAYTVQSGDSLLALARASGTTAGQLQAVNCIPDANILIANTNIWVPRLPVRETPAPLTTSDPDRMMTLTAVSTVVIEPSLTVTSVTPTAVAISPTVGITPTVAISTTVTPQPKATVAVTVTATAVQTATLVPVDLTATVPVTTPTTIPRATPTVTPTPAATVTSTPAATMALTETAATTPAPALTAATEATVPIDATATEVPDAGEVATATTTPTAGATASTSTTANTATPNTATATPLLTPTAVPTFTPFPTDDGEGEDDESAEGASSGGEDEGTENAPTATATSESTPVVVTPTTTPTPTKPATGVGTENQSGGSGNNRRVDVSTATATPVHSSPLARGD